MTAKGGRGKSGGIGLKGKRTHGQQCEEEGDIGD